MELDFYPYTVAEYWGVLIHWHEEHITPGMKFHGEPEAEDYSDYSKTFYGEVREIRRKSGSKRLTDFVFGNLLNWMKTVRFTWIVGCGYHDLHAKTLAEIVTYLFLLVDSEDHINYVYLPIFDLIGTLSYLSKRYHGVKTIHQIANAYAQLCRKKEVNVRNLLIGKKDLETQIMKTVGEDTVKIRNVWKIWSELVPDEGHVSYAQWSPEEVMSDVFSLM